MCVVNQWYINLCLSEDEKVGCLCGTRLPLTQARWADCRWHDLISGNKLREVSIKFWVWGFELRLHIVIVIFIVGQVLLRDPTDENVIPVVEELHRRLPPVNVIRQGQVNIKEYPGGQNDMEASVEDGIWYWLVV